MSRTSIAALVLALALAAPGRAAEPTVPAAPAAPAVAAAPAAPAGAPRAVFEKIELDAGEVTRGQDVPFTFVVNNTGDAVLKILSAKPG